MPADALDADLPRARGDRVVRLRREDEVARRRPRRAAAGPAESPRKQATLSSPRSFVQTRLSEKTPSKSKTTRRISVRSVTLRARRRAASTSSTSSSATACSHASGRTSVRPSRPSSSYGGRPPSAGDFATRSPGARTCPAGRSRAATSFFPIFSSGRSSLASGRFTPSPTRVGDAVQIANEPPHPLGHERERVIRALPRMVEREVLLDDARAEHVADERHRDPALVVGEPDHELGEALAVRLDDTEVELLDLARVRPRCTA